ncbi:hypothetical protein HMN09_01307100 [Mycena chlorophos]|uniref:Uncharacterized protein n=1 Tax=Mycena chlorophos TaxID=658473 RepID=A0A8H6S0Y4_MYCCL|nr:hypothetical protein HMN09_01307100 [Mycena chlorophos]
MHPCLELSNVRRLHSGLRVCVMAAANGSQSDLEVIVESFEIDEGEELWTEGSVQPLLPAFYKCIDNAELSAYRGLIDWDRDANKHLAELLQRVLWAFRGLEFILSKWKLPFSAFSQIWERAWAWIQFIDEFHTNLALPNDVWPYESPKGTLDRTYACIISLLVHVWKRIRQEGAKNDAWQLVSDSRAPGIFAIVSHAWARFLPARRSYYSGLDEISSIIIDDHHCHPIDGARLNDLLSGVGGEWAEVALLVVRHIRRASRNCVIGDPRAIDDDDAQMVRAMLVIVEAADVPTILTHQMWTQGLIRGLIHTILGIFSNPNLRDRLALSKSIMNVVSTVLAKGEAHTLIPGALRAGLLKAIEYYCTIVDGPDGLALLPLIQTTLSLGPR